MIDKLLKAINEAESLEDKAAKIGNDRDALYKRLKEARSVLADKYKKEFKSYFYDFNKKRLVSKTNPKLALIWTNDGKTSVGSVSLYELDDQKEIKEELTVNNTVPESDEVPFDAEINVFKPGTPEYQKLEKAAYILTQKLGRQVVVDNTYFDYGQKWMWTTLLEESDPEFDLGRIQIVYPPEQRELLYGDFDKAINAIADRQLNESVEEEPQEGQSVNIKGYKIYHRTPEDKEAVAGTSNYSVSHPEIGYCGDFDNFKDAKEYAQLGESKNTEIKETVLNEGPSSFVTFGFKDADIELDKNNDSTNEVYTVKNLRLSSYYDSDEAYDGGFIELDLDAYLEDAMNKVVGYMPDNINRVEILRMEDYTYGHGYSRLILGDGFNTEPEEPATCNVNYIDKDGDEVDVEIELPIIYTPSDEVSDVYEHLDREKEMAESEEEEKVFAIYDAPEDELYETKAVIKYYKGDRKFYILFMDSANNMVNSAGTFDTIEEAKAHLEKIRPNYVLRLGDHELEQDMIEVVVPQEIAYWLQFGDEAEISEEDKAKAERYQQMGDIHFKYDELKDVMTDDFGFASNATTIMIDRKNELDEAEEIEFKADKDKKAEYLKKLEDEVKAEMSFCIKKGENEKQIKEQIMYAFSDILPDAVPLIYYYAPLNDHFPDQEVIDVIIGSGKTTDETEDARFDEAWDVCLNYTKENLDKWYSEVCAEGNKIMEALFDKPVPYAEGAKPEDLDNIWVVYHFIDAKTEDGKGPDENTKIGLIDFINNEEENRAEYDENNAYEPYILSRDISDQELMNVIEHGETHAFPEAEIIEVRPYSTGFREDFDSDENFEANAKRLRDMYVNGNLGKGASDFQKELTKLLKTYGKTEDDFKAVTQDKPVDLKAGEFAEEPVNETLVTPYQVIFYNEDEKWEYTGAFKTLEEAKNFVLEHVKNYPATVSFEILKADGEKPGKFSLGGGKPDVTKEEIDQLVHEKQDSIKEEYGEYHGEPEIEHIGEEIENGNDYGYEPYKFGNWSLHAYIDNEKDIFDSESNMSNDLLDYFAREISYPVKDGHISYSGLDIIINSGSGLTKENLLELKDWTDGNYFDEKDIDAMLNDEKELEFWMDYDIEYDENVEKDEEDETLEEAANEVVTSMVGDLEVKLPKDMAIKLGHSGLPADQQADLISEIKELPMVKEQIANWSDEDVKQVSYYDFDIKGLDKEDIVDFVILVAAEEAPVEQIEESAETPNIIQSLKDDYVAGKMSAKEVASELAKANLTPCIVSDAEALKKIGINESKMNEGGGAGVEFVFDPHSRTGIGLTTKVDLTGEGLQIKVETLPLASYEDIQIADNGGFIIFDEQKVKEAVVYTYNKYDRHIDDPEISVEDIQSLDEINPEDISNLMYSAGWIRGELPKDSILTWEKYQPSGYLPEVEVIFTKTDGEQVAVSTVRVDGEYHISEDVYYAYIQLDSYEDEEELEESLNEDENKSFDVYNYTVNHPIYFKSPKGSMLNAKKENGVWYVLGKEVTDENLISHLEDELNTAVKDNEKTYGSLMDDLEYELWDSGNLSIPQQDMLQYMLDNGIVERESGREGEHDTANGVARWIYHLVESINETDFVLGKRVAFPGSKYEMEIYCKNGKITKCNINNVSLGNTVNEPIVEPVALDELNPDARTSETIEEYLVRLADHYDIPVSAEELNNAIGKVDNIKENIKENNMESVIDIFDAEMKNEPCFETANGVMYLEPTEKTIKIGGLTNSGVIPSYEFDYDFSQSLDWNIQGMIEQVLEEEGYPEEEIEEDNAQLESLAEKLVKLGVRRDSLGL